MGQNTQPENTIIDYITGRVKPDCGAESNRQKVERLLVENKGYDREDIEVDTGIALDMGTEVYEATIDLVVSVNGFRYMVVKCAAGSLDSREREVIAAARLLETHQIPLSVASDGSNALVWNTVSGRSLGSGLSAIPSKARVLEDFDPASLSPLDDKRRERQKLIFRTYATQSCGVGPDVRTNDRI